jgi:hypothetical protein
MKLKAPDGVKEIQVFVDKRRFPVAVYICDDWEKTQLSYFNPNDHDAVSLCKWCRNHHIQYQVLYPAIVRNLLKEPETYRKYCKIVDGIRKEPT